MQRRTGRRGRGGERHPRPLLGGDGKGCAWGWKWVRVVGAWGDRTGRRETLRAGWGGVLSVEINGEIYSASGNIGKFGVAIFPGHASNRGKALISAFSHL